MPFVALKALRYTTPDARVIDAAPGEVLPGFSHWPPGTQTALLELRMAAYQGDPMATTGIVAPTSTAPREIVPLPTPPSAVVLNPLACPECERADFANAAGLARHRTRAHGA